MRFAVEGAGGVSALLLRPAKARWLLALAHGAGAGMIHPFMAKSSPPKPLEFDLPPEATRSGDLILNWYREPGLGDNGRGCHVAEVWLIKVLAPVRK